MKKSLQFFACTIVLLLWTTISFAQTGRIAGTVVDASSDEPLPGVNVVLDGTTQGATTNIDGYYTILNVPPGTYTLQASFIGYRRQFLEGVRVNIGLTTEADFTLEEEAVGLEEVVVQVERPIVQRDISANIANLSMEDFQNLPVASVEGVINLQAGIEPGLSIRGGGLDEVSFLVDGMSMRDGRNNTPFIGVSYTAISEVQVQTGGFNAEYGNVRSGLVNVVTREGPRDRYVADVITRYSPSSRKNFGISPGDPESYWMRPWLDPDVAFTGTHSAESPWDPWTRNQYPQWQGWNTVSEALAGDGNPQTNLTPQELQEVFKWRTRKDFDAVAPDYEFDGSFGGPVPIVGKQLGDLRFFGSYRQTQNGYIVPMRRDAYNDRTGQLKLTSNIGSGMKIQLHGMHAVQYGHTTTHGGDATIFRGETPKYPWDTRSTLLANRLFRDAFFALDYWSLTDVTTTMVGGEFTHSVSPNSFYNVRLQRVGTDYSTYMGPQRDETVIKTVGAAGFPLDEAPYGWQVSPENDFSGFSIGSQWGKARDTSNVAVWSGRFDFTSQLNRYSQVKTGVEFAYSDYDMRHGEIDSLWLHHANPYYRWERQPLQAAAYAQNKLEFLGMVANLGLRVDYMNPGGSWYSYDPFDRALSPMFGAKMLDEMLDEEPTEKQLTLSPRLGVSYPITENSKLYFNYGHFRQMLDPNSMFRVREINTGAVDQIGNPNHPMPKTVAYELGFEQNIADQFLLRTTGYYKSVSLQPASVQFTSIDGQVNYVVSQPNNYVDTRGVEMTLSKDRGRWFRGFLNYTYMVRKGGNFGLNRELENRVAMAQFIRETRQHYQNRPVPEPFARLSLDLVTPQDFGPDVLGMRPFQDWRLNLLGEWRAGQVFTWSGPGGDIPGLENNVRWKDYYNLDMRFSKNITSTIGDMQFFMDIINVLNVRHLNRGSAFLGSNDFRDYMLSLHMPEDIFDDIEGTPYTYIHGSDRPGDFRKPGVEYHPIVIIEESLPETGHDRPLYYDKPNDEYYVWVNNGWQEAEASTVDQVLRDKAYIDMPNANFFRYLNPRNFVFGVRVRLQ